MQTTTIPCHSAACLTPGSDDVQSGQELPKGRLIFGWGLRDADLELTVPIAQFEVQGIDPDVMIALGQHMVEEGQRLKALESGLSIVEGTAEVSKVLAGDLAGSTP